MGLGAGGALRSPRRRTRKRQCARLRVFIFSSRHRERRREEKEESCTQVERLGSQERTDTQNPELGSRTGRGVSAWKGLFSTGGYVRAPCLNSSVVGNASVDTGHATNVASFAPRFTLLATDRVRPSVLSGEGIIRKFGAEMNTVLGA